MSGLDMLAGVHVLEIAEGVCGSMCGKVLGDLGATITKVESPEGDWLQHLMLNEPGRSPVYQQLNAGKRIITADLKSRAGQDRVEALARTADICVVGHRQSKLPTLGLTYDRLKVIAPRMVYCHISGWGTTGPMGDRAASELCIQVVAGLTQYLGTLDSPPVRQGFDLVSVDTGIAAAQAALAALLWREHSGAGQYVEVSMLATAVALMQWDIAAQSGPDAWQGRQLLAQDWPADHGFQCADTRCLIDLRSNEEAWPALLRDIGCDDLADDPRFATRTGIDLYGTELPALTASRMSQWSFDDLQRVVRDKYDGTIVPMLNIPDVIAHPQVHHLGLIGDGPVRRIRFPMEMR
jgi:crotonobetainyl-CoA:carnitine CoA-transferase CaiB-like acyl-CoA transferase